MYIARVGREIKMTILRPRRPNTASSSYAACHLRQPAESALDTTIGGKRHPLDSQVLADHSLHRSSQARRPAVQPNSTTTTTAQTLPLHTTTSPLPSWCISRPGQSPPLQQPTPPYPTTTTTKLPPPWRVSIPSLPPPFHPPPRPMSPAITVAIHPSLHPPRTYS